MNKEYRFVLISNQGHIAHAGNWRPYDLAQFLKCCEAWAENDCTFNAEFRFV